ncbi:MAG: hypothetical protein IJ223_02935 [Clostridia bacterium]|nr:hypothetical protein [Clostridia bacterium]
MHIKQIIEITPVFELTGKENKKDYVQYRLKDLDPEKLAFWIKNGEDAVIFKKDKIRIFPKGGIQY